MLISLNISNLAVVESLQLDFAQGMSVLTGETGAGKSILLTALGLALGERATTDYIRPHCKRAEINLEFDLSTLPDALEWLKNHDIDDETHCLIRRVMTDDGRSKAYINNSPVTLQTLQTLTRQLVEIHGQHAHLTLLHHEEQQRLLDVYGKNEALLKTVNACYENWQRAEQELKKLKKQKSETLQRQELLNYQLEELQLLNLADFNYQALTEQHQKLANLEHILMVGQTQLNQLYEQDNSLYQKLKQSLKELTQISQFAPELNNVVHLIEEARIQIQEAVYDLRHFLNNQEINPEQLQLIEQQLNVLQTLSRKHHVKPDELYVLEKNIRQELSRLQNCDERTTELENLLLEYEKNYHENALLLSEKRKIAAQKLEKHISQMMKELGMPNGTFFVDVETHNEKKPTLNGCDKITFLISTNVGLPAKSLAKVASGGELSRISLAIQVATAHDKTVPTMIFDEVDSGIGGAIAEIVGQKLRQLSQNRQILCVTHLPQVAAQAHQHLYVEKQHEKTMTTSQVKLLSTQERLAETARMLGGIEITENTLAHAKEMLDFVN